MRLQKPEIDRGIARCRLVLSIVATIAVYLDPTIPIVTRHFALEAGPFTLDPLPLLFFVAHGAYSWAILLRVRHHGIQSRRQRTALIWIDVGWCILIGVLTEGSTSPLGVFFEFAVLEAALTAGLGLTMLVSAASAQLYLGFLLMSDVAESTRFLMRPVYFIISGYLVGYLGQQRLRLEAQIRARTAAAQREQIARELHDGRAQAFAAINLRLESCKELLRRGSLESAVDELSALQAGVNEEYDQMRTYMRGLAEIASSPPPRSVRGQTEFKVHLDCDLPSETLHHVMQIMREGVANICNHAGAEHASVDVRRDGNVVVIHIDDDGVGFTPDQLPPWTIASVVRRLGGQLDIHARQGRDGAHVAISIPVSA